MIRFTLIFLGLTIAACVLQAAPVDLSPPSATLGAASSEGYVLLLREIDEADYGNGLKLPVRIQFKSQPGENSQFLGAGWKIPLLECNSGIYQEGMMRAELPCGKKLWLLAKRRGAQEFETLDGEWKGKADDKTFTVYRKDGWEIKYVEGRISYVKTDGGRLIQWAYDGKRAIAVSEGGNSAFKVLFDQEGKLSGFIVNDRKHLVEMGKKPRVVEVADQRLVEALDPTLVKWIFPDSRGEEYNFAVDGDGFPSLSITDAEKKESDYSWEAKSGVIRSEGEWKYQVGTKEGKFGLPTLARINPQGIKEETVVDSKTGKYTNVSGNGEKTVTYVFKAPGPLYDKVQKIDALKNESDGREISVPLYRASYDESGRLMRSTDEKGYVTTFEYGKDGVLKNKIFTKSKELAEELAIKEKKMLEVIAKASSDPQKKRLFSDLADFYLFEERDSAKALALLPNIDPKFSYVLRVQAIDYDPALTPAQKIVGYRQLLKDFPDRKPSLEFLIQAREEEIK